MTTCSQCGKKVKRARNFGNQCWRLIPPLCPVCSVNKTVNPTTKGNSG